MIFNIDGIEATTLRTTISIFKHDALSIHNAFLSFSGNLFISIINYNKTPQHNVVSNRRNTYMTMNSKYGCVTKANKVYQY